ncbi:MAG: flagellar biosynthetic protein FliO [Chlamydiota bacterium]
MKLCNFLLIFILTLGASPLVAQTSSDTKDAKVEKPAPKYFHDVAEDKPMYDESSFLGELVNMFITLGFIIIILIALAWVMRRMQNSRIQYTNETSDIKLVDHRSLSAKSVVYLLHVHGRAIVVSDSQSGVMRLADFPIDEESEDPNTAISKKRFETFIKDK